MSKKTPFMPKLLKKIIVGFKKEKKETEEMDKWNGKIAKMYVNMVKQENDYSVIQCEKMSYAITVVLSEVEKMTAFLIVSILLDAANIFLLSVIVVLSLRVTMGGMHRKTFWGCFLFSLCFFLSVIVLSKNIALEWDVVNVIMYGSYLVIVVFQAPLPSATRPKLSLKRRKKLKLYSFCVVTGWMFVTVLLHGNFIWRNCIEWTLLLHILEIYIVKGGRVLWQKIELLKK